MLRSFGVLRFCFFSVSRPFFFFFFFLGGGSPDPFSPLFSRKNYLQTHIQPSTLCKGTIRILLFVSYITNGYLILSLWHQPINVPLSTQIKLLLFFHRTSSLSCMLQLKTPNTRKPTQYFPLSPSLMSMANTIFSAVIQTLNVYQLQTRSVADLPIQGMPRFCRFTLNKGPIIFGPCC